jgi:M6 family metalloprotease-like protein
MEIQASFLAKARYLNRAMIRPWSSSAFFLLVTLSNTAENHVDNLVNNLCKLKTPSSIVAPGRLSEGFATPTLYVPSVGILKGAMVFVDFDDTPANDTIESLYRSLLPDAADWYSNASYGRLNLVVHVDKSRFHRMPKPSTAYKWDRNGADQGTYIRDLIEVLGPSAKLESSDVFYIVPTRAAEHISFSPTSLYPITLEDGTEMSTVVTIGQDLHTKWGYKVLNHETGHTMGLPDLYPSDSTKLARGDWVGGYDIMGLINGTSPDYFTWHKWKLGWLDDNQVDCISQKGTSKHVITPLEIAGGVKAAAVKLSSTKAFVTELRMTAAYNASCSIGLVSYVINTAGDNSYRNAAPIEVLDAHTTNKGCSPARGGKLTGAAMNFLRGEREMSFGRYGVNVTIDGVKDDNYEITIKWDGKSSAGGFATYPNWPAVEGSSKEESDEDER